MQWFIGDTILFVGGFCAYPILMRYFLIPVGATVWEDVKNVASAIWGKITGMWSTPSAE